LLQLVPLNLAFQMLPLIREILCFQKLLLAPEVLLLLLPRLHLGYQLLLLLQKFLMDPLLQLALWHR